MYNHGFPGFKTVPFVCRIDLQRSLLYLQEEAGSDLDLAEPMEFNVTLTAVSTNQACYCE